MSSNRIFHTQNTVNVRGHLIDLSHPRVMGIINLTPDSFYAGSRKPAVDDALQQTEKMLNDGADFLDLGAYSSRPGAEDISVQQETDRLLPAVEAISAAFGDAIISIDTFRAPVAEAAIKAGAHIINDISGGQLDTDMFATVARLKVPYILMHMKGNPQNMVKLAQYDDVFTEVLDYFAVRVDELRRLGVHDIIIDPGFGFAKESHHSYELMRRLPDFAMLGLPVLAGVSRKRMIYHLLGTTAAEALNGTTALNTIALMNGARVLRVHDVREAVEAVEVFSVLNQDL